MSTLQDKIRGSMIGGAIGDALGYPVSNISLQEIRNKYGDAGITKFELDNNGIAVFSNETQMALFTANAILHGDTKSSVLGTTPQLDILILDAHSEWAWTHKNIPSKEKHLCWIRDIAALNVNRGSVYDEGLRLFPLGLWGAASTARGCEWTQESVLKLAYECCFRSPKGYFSSVYLPLLLFCICSQKEGFSASTLSQMILTLCSVITDVLPDELNASGMSLLLEKSVCLELMEKSICLATNSLSDEENIQSLGRARTGDESLAIALYCVLRHFDSFEDAIVAAANHDGNSCVSAAICGSIMGAIYGYDRIPSYHKDNLELSDVIIALADDLTQGCNFSDGDNSQSEQIQWMSRYIDMYPHGFPHLELTHFDFRYPIPGIEDKIGNWWPNIDTLLKDNSSDFFFFNDDGKTSSSHQEEIFGFWWPCSLRIENVSYNSAGQFLEAEKARIFSDMQTREKILRATSKQEILDLGKQIKEFDDDVWVNYRNSVALYGNYQKFTQNEACKKALLETKDRILIYDSSDSDWGIGFDRTDERIQDPANWELDNLLGYSLMTVRNIIIKPNTLSLFNRN
ncbi:MAG: DUF1768 domain-containing protein [Bacteroidales bacterium]|nr:DUF1768 domain-containing protein [Bacteroidales bacterium]